MIKRIAIVLALCCFATPIAALPDEPGELFDNVARVLEEKFYDKAYRQEVLPELADRYRPQARAAMSVDEERAVIQEYLSHIPASHLALLSRATYDEMIRALTSKRAPTFGFELVEENGVHRVESLLEGGPAMEAGVLRGDRVLLIDDVPPGESPRLDWRSDDAWHPDPPVRALLAAEDETIHLRLERTRGETLEIDVTTAEYSAFDAARASARVYERDGVKIAYIHFWFIHMGGVDTLLQEKIEGEFADADALVLDLRGRGGSAAMARRVAGILKGRGSKWNRPVVALIDARTRSAKEAIAYDLRSKEVALLVGERTAGALLPATFIRVSDDAVLMYPSFKLRRYSDLIEGEGVPPHVKVEPPGVYSAGQQPLIEAGIDEAVKLIEAESDNDDRGTRVALGFNPAYPLPPSATRRHPGAGLLHPAGEVAGRAA